MEKKQPVQMEPMFHQLIIMSPPTVMGGSTNVQVIDPGITLRDHFAGVALSSLVLTVSSNEPVFLAALSYELADAMMQERARWKGGKRS